MSTNIDDFAPELTSEFKIQFDDDLLKSPVIDVSKLRHPECHQYVYVATCMSGIHVSVFKIGGVKHKSELQSRLDKYNLDCNSSNPYFYIWIEKCRNHSLVEFAFWTKCSDYLDVYDTENDTVYLRIDQVLDVLRSSIRTMETIFHECRKYASRSRPRHITYTRVDENTIRVGELGV